MNRWHTTRASVGNHYSSPLYSVFLLLPPSLPLSPCLLFFYKRKKKKKENKTFFVAKRLWEKTAGHLKSRLFGRRGENGNNTALDDRIKPLNLLRTCRETMI